MRGLLLQEAAEFRWEAARFISGEVDEETFRTFRLRRGIYGQRQPGVQMVRIKIPSGIATAAQLRTIAEVAEEFGHGIGHITTRQDIQLHFVKLARAADAMERLAYGDLTTREACGNSVRNVTACAVAGHCPGQAFDVRPYSLAVSRRLIRNPLGAALPRKFKIAFSCSLKDCALGDINDIGADALVRDGKKGFRIRVGGGLGPSPQAAQTLYEFLLAEELGEVCDAILRVFDAHGNRNDKHRARMKFVLRQHGLEWFSQKVEEARAAHPPKPLTLAPVQQEAPGEPFLVVVPQGNLSAVQLRRLAELAERFGNGAVTFTVNQNLVINGVLPHDRAALGRDVRGAALFTEQLADIVTCPGAATCNLGLTRTMDLGKELFRVFSEDSDALTRQIRVRISGCPNSCGHHHVGDIGFYGNARKVEGESAPFYQLLLRGGKADDPMHFGQAVLPVPARLAPEVVERIVGFYKAQRNDGESFPEFVSRVGIQRFRDLLAQLPDTELETLLVDWGEQERYAVKLGRGECAT